MAKKPKKRKEAQRPRDPDGKLRRTVVTPEGVGLSLILAGAGDRAGAVMIDLVAISLAMIGIAMLGLFLWSEIEGVRWLLPLFILLFFAVRSFYFIFFELRWQGRTPGKRLLGLRVIDQRGGPLTADAIFARNLLRELELFLPISLAFSGSAVAPVDAWIQLLAWIWVGVFLLLPLFNKDNLRAGDMVGGTWVVRMPKGVLPRDLTAAEETSPEALEAARLKSDKAALEETGYRFSDAQLAIYGIYELQTLEDVLRRENAKAHATHQAVADKIRRKIDWLPPPGRRVEAKAFLEAFYAALRAHLEKRMVFGERREDKHHGAPDNRKPPS